MVFSTGKQKIVRMIEKIGIVGGIRMTSKKSSIGDCNNCNVESCKNICYQRYAKLFDDKYKNQDNETELTNPIIIYKSLAIN